MTVAKDAFKKFQDDLAALDSKFDPKPSKAMPISDLDHAKADFIVLKRRYGLKVADVMTFFPEQESIAYLEQLIVQERAKASKGR